MYNFDPHSSRVASIEDWLAKAPASYAHHEQYAPRSPDGPETAQNPTHRAPTARRALRSAPS